jgi:hypothetical protein
VGCREFAQRSAANSTSTFLIYDLPAAAERQSGRAAGKNRGWRRKWHGTAESSMRVDRFAAMALALALSASCTWAERIGIEPS